MKILKVHVINVVQNHDRENYETSGGVFFNTPTTERYTMVMDWKIQYDKMPVLFKLIFRLNAIKFPGRFL